MDCPVQGAKLGSLEQDALEAGGYNTEGQVMPEVWRKRLLGPLEDEQVEIGPLLGRGGYGKVSLPKPYKLQGLVSRSQKLSMGIS